MEPIASQDRPMGRFMQMFLACFGVVLGAVVVGATLVALAISDHRSGQHQAVAIAGSTVARSPSPTAAGPSALPTPVAAPATADPVRQAQEHVDGLVTQFAQSLDVTERRRLLEQIRRLAATPGVTVPNH